MFYRFSLLAVAVLVIASILSGCFGGGKVCKLQINGLDSMKYDKTELRVKASECSSVELTLTHTGKLAKNAMGHNWVLSEEGNMQAVVGAGMQAGLPKGYLPDDRSQVLAATKMLGGGETDTIKFDLKKLSKDKSYSFFCTFPGHFALMKGKFILE